MHEAGGYREESRQQTLGRRALIAGGVAAGAVLAVRPWRHLGGHPEPAATGAGAAAGSDRAAARAAGSGLEIVRRAAWGAEESRRGPAVYDAAVEKLVVHHTAIDDGTGQWARQVREIYESETADGYRDIAYHFLVDPHGTIYEGRWARDYPSGTTPDGEDATRRAVRGGHARGHNPRTLGIALLGDYTRAVPTDAALGAIVELLAWKCARWRIDPNGATPYVDMDGGRQAFPNIVGHGQIRATQCPGTHLNALLPGLRTSTARALSTHPSTGGA